MRSDLGLGVALTSPLRSQKRAQCAEIVSVEEVDACVVEGLPDSGAISGRPEAEQATFCVSLGYDVRELGRGTVRHGAATIPRAEAQPVVGDQRHEGYRYVLSKVAEAAVEGGVSDGLRSQRRAGAAARKNGHNWAGIHRCWCEDRHDVGVAAQKRAERSIGCLGIGFDVDKQDKRLLRGIYPTAMYSYVGAQRSKVQRLKCTFRHDIFKVMRHEERAIYQVNVGLDADETVVQCVEQRARMLVVVVGVGAQEWLRKRGRCKDADNERKQESHSRQWRSGAMRQGSSPSALTH